MEPGLPEVVRAYVDRSVGGERQPSRVVRLEQAGEMFLKPGARPRAFTATEELAVDRVEFAWRARFPMVGPISMRVIDSYDGTDGRLEVRVIGIPIQRKRGPELARGEALRYLAEIPWVPQAILANPHLTWRAVDDRTVEVATSTHDEQIALQLVFNHAGDIAQTIAQRPRLEAGSTPTTWIGEYAEYKQFDRVRLPSRGEVRWELPDGPFVYWRGKITALDLDSGDLG